MLVELNLVDISFSCLYSSVSDYTGNYFNPSSSLSQLFAVIIMGVVLFVYTRMASLLQEKSNLKKKLQKNDREVETFNDRFLGNILAQGLKETNEDDATATECQGKYLEFSFMAKILVVLFIVVGFQNRPFSCLITILSIQLASSLYLIRTLFTSRSSGVFESWPACLSHFTTELTLLAFSILSLAQSLIIKDANKHSSSSSTFNTLGVALVILIIFCITMEGLDFCYTCWRSVSKLFYENIKSRRVRQKQRQRLSKVTVSRNRLKRLARNRMQSTSQLGKYLESKSKGRTTLQGSSDQSRILSSQRFLNSKNKRSRGKRLSSLSKLHQKNSNLKGEKIRNLDSLKRPIRENSDKRRKGDIDFRAFRERGQKNEFVGVKNFYEKKKSTRSQNRVRRSYKKLNRFQKANNNQ